MCVFCTHKSIIWSVWNIAIWLLLFDGKCCYCCEYLDASFVLCVCAHILLKFNFGFNSFGSIFVCIVTVTATARSLCHIHIAAREREQKKNTHTHTHRIHCLSWAVCPHLAFFVLFHFFHVSNSISPCAVVMCVPHALSRFFFLFLSLKIVHLFLQSACRRARSSMHNAQIVNCALDHGALHSTIVVYSISYVNANSVLFFFACIVCISARFYTKRTKSKY